MWSNGLFRFEPRNSSEFTANNSAARNSVRGSIQDVVFDQIPNLEFAEAPSGYDEVAVNVLETIHAEESETCDTEQGHSDSLIQIVVTVGRDSSEPQLTEHNLSSSGTFESISPPQDSVRNDVLHLLQTIGAEERVMRCELDHEVLVSLDSQAENHGQVKSGSDDYSEYAARMAQKVQMQASFDNPLHVCRLRQNSLVRQTHHRGFIRRCIDKLNKSSIVAYRNRIDNQLCGFMIVWAYAHVVAAAVTTAVQATSTAGLFCFPYVGAFALIFDFPFLGVIVIDALREHAVVENGWLGETSTWKALSAFGFIVILIMLLPFTYGIYAFATLPSPSLSDSNYGLYAGAIWFYIESILSFLILVDFATDILDEDDSSWFSRGTVLVSISLPFVVAGIVSAVLQSNAGKLYMWKDIGVTGPILFGWIPAIIVAAIFTVVFSGIIWFVCACDCSYVPFSGESDFRIARAAFSLAWFVIASLGIRAIRSTSISPEVVLYVGAVLFYIGVCICGITLCLGTAMLYLRDDAED